MQIFKALVVNLLVISCNLSSLLYISLGLDLFFFLLRPDFAYFLFFTVFTLTHKELHAAVHTQLTFPFFSESLVQTRLLFDFWLF